MAAKKALAGIAAAAILSLAASFNHAAAQTAPQAVSAPAANQNVPGALQQGEQRSRAMLEAIRGIDEYFFSENHPGKTNPEYSTKADPFIQDSVKKILDKLSEGADPNYIDPQSGISAFAWGLWIAYELDRPDIVKAFLDRGADPRQTLAANMPIPQSEQNAVKIIFGPLYETTPGGQITIMDHVMRALLEVTALNERYRSTLSHNRTAAEIAAMIMAHGQTEADARQIPDEIKYETVTKAGTVQETIPFKLKTIKDIAGLNILSAFALHQAGLISADDYTAIADGTPEIAKAARNMQKITREVLESHEAPLVFYPDAVPGGPEPYTVKQGDTPQSLARRFQSVMGAASEAEALRLFSELNKKHVTAQGAFAADMTGKQILIPVQKHIQVGTRPAPGPIDALIGVVRRMQMLIGTSDLNEALEAVIEVNNITLEGESNIADIVKIGAELKIPTLLGKTVSTKITAEDALRSVASSVQPNFYRQNTPPAAVLQELLAINEIDPANMELKNCDIEDVDLMLKQCETMIVPYVNDGIANMQILTPPASRDPDRKVHLFVVEGESSHQKDASRSATNTSYTINPDVDFSQFHVLRDAVWLPHADTSNEASAIMQILQHPENPMRDRIVFTSSMISGVVGERGVPVPIAENQRQHNSADHAAFEIMRLNLDTLEKASPIIFQASGNEFPDEGRFSGRYSTSHSGRTVLIGAYGTYGGNRMMAPYTSFAADICGPLPSNLGRQLEGTSFSTPSTAGIYRQLAEWYGNILTFEEIMAAGMMTADRDILDLFARPGQAPRRPETAQYRTNGAGLPYNERCGAGALNIQRWNEALKEMVALKTQHQPSAAFRSLKIDFDQAPAVRTLANGKKEYVYRIAVPETMTLGKLTFLLPQHEFAHSEVVVKAPSGFEYHLQKSLADIVSTSAFSYEDVKAGDVIEIRTGAPLAENAGMYLRGYENGNTIQLLRENLQAQGMLPAPLKTMTGDKVTGDDPGLQNIDLNPAPPPLPERNEPQGSAAPERPEPPLFPRPYGPAPR